MILISAHRFGAGEDRRAENTLAALERAVGLGVDFVEFDVRRLPSGRLVVAHDPAQATEAAPAYEEVLDRIAGRVGAHIDLKLTGRDATYDARRGADLHAVRTAVERLLLLPGGGSSRVPGVPRVVVTMGNVEAVRAVRDWADRSGADVLVGLSLGRWTDLWPGARLRRSRADVIVAHWLLARLGVARLARRRGLPLLVWTVDRPGELRHWLRPGRCWMLTTNHPDLALALRRPRRDGL